MHREIIETSETNQEFQISDFRKIVMKIITAHGIVNLPEEILFSLLTETYLKKYASKINLKEFELAFQLHVVGDLGQKFNHFQMFSVEWMCDILNLYLKKKNEAEIKLRGIERDVPKELPILDMFQETLNEIVRDYELLQDDLTGINYVRIKDKLEAVCQIFGLEITVEILIEKRESAFKAIIKRLIAERHEYTLADKFGQKTDVSFKLARFKAGKGLTENDEALIQQECLKQIYFDMLRSLESDYFYEGIKINR